jgi:hypothetical protein
VTRTDHRTTGLPAIAIVMLLVGCTAASPTAIPSTTAPPSPSSGESRAPEPSLTPSPEPSADPTSMPDGPASWRRTDSFPSDPVATYVTDLVAWSEGFVAIGSTFESRNIAGAESPVLWVSTDGRSWEERPIDVGLDDVALVGIAPLGGGESLLIVGRTPGQFGGSPELGPPGSHAWTSADGASWSPVDLPVADGAQVTSFDHGPAGYAMVVDGALWHSADGTSWTRTLEGGASRVVAGDEGFVALRTDADAPAVVASADGVTWYEAAPVGVRVSSVAPLGGDWLAVAWNTDAGISVWHSTDGLAWTQVLDVDDLTAPDGPKTGRGLEYDSIGDAVLAGGAGHAFVTLTQNHCCAELGWNHGTWTTTDGRTWSPMPSAAVTDAEPFGSLVSAVASNDGETVVLGGHVGRGRGAAFWVGEH